MVLVRLSDETSALASMFPGMSTEELGSILTPELAQQMPTARPSAIGELPPFPSVVRGPACSTSTGRGHTRAPSGSTDSM